MRFYSLLMLPLCLIVLELFLIQLFDNAVVEGAFSGFGSSRKGKGMLIYIKINRQNDLYMRRFLIRISKPKIEKDKIKFKIRIIFQFFEKIYLHPIFYLWVNKQHAKDEYTINCKINTFYLKFAKNFTTLNFKLFSFIIKNLLSVFDKKWIY